MARRPTFVIAAGLMVGLLPGLAAAQPAQSGVSAPQGPLSMTPKWQPNMPLYQERSPGGLNLEPSGSSGGGLRLMGSDARISPTMSAPTAAEAPPTDRNESRVPGLRLRVPW